VRRVSFNDLCTHRRTGKHLLRTHCLRHRSHHGKTLGGIKIVLHSCTSSMTGYVEKPSMVTKKDCEPFGLSLGRQKRLSKPNAAMENNFLLCT
jgi:hypothetical protein